MAQVLSPLIHSATEKVPQSLPNFWVNFLVRFASKPLFYWVAPSNFKGVQTMKCTLWTETLEFSRLKVPNSRFSPSLIHGLCTVFLPRIQGLCAFSRPLLTPVSTAPFLPASQITVCTSRFTRPRELFRKAFGAVRAFVLASGFLFQQ